MPTENGTVLDTGRRPASDAAVVARLRLAGALVVGKTVTSELANRGPGKTCNPLDYERTPGGSSSGSAAAVASGMVAVALGTQTGGSVIRPSAFCGIVGFKPSLGSLPRTGVLQQSSTLDTVGVHARSLGDAALLAQALAGEDASSPPRGALDFVSAATGNPPARPRIGFVKQAVWPLASAATQRELQAFVDALGDQCQEVPLSREFEAAHACHRCIHVAEMAKCYRGYIERGRDQLSEALQAAMDEGAAVTAVAYQLALDQRRQLMAELERHWPSFDVMVTPAANGEAPLGLQSTGDPAFCAVWTMLGVPSVTLPLLKGDTGMPIGVQLIGRRGDDAALLSHANYINRWFEETYAK